MTLTKIVRNAVVAPWVSELRNHSKGVSICQNHLKLLTGRHPFPNQLILLAGAGSSWAVEEIGSLLDFGERLSCSLYHTGQLINWQLITVVWASEKAREHPYDTATALCDYFLEISCLWFFRIASVKRVTWSSPAQGKGMMPRKQRSVGAVV